MFYKIFTLILLLFTCFRTCISTDTQEEYALTLWQPPAISRERIEEWCQYKTYQTLLIGDIYAHSEVIIKNPELFCLEILRKKMLLFGSVHAEQFTHLTPPIQALLMTPPKLYAESIFENAELKDETHADQLLQPWFMDLSEQLKSYLENQTAPYLQPYGQRIGFYPIELASLYYQVSFNFHFTNIGFDYALQKLYINNHQTIEVIEENPGSDVADKFHQTYFNGDAQDVIAYFTEEYKHFEKYGFSELEWDCEQKICKYRRGDFIDSDIDEPNIDIKRNKHMFEHLKHALILSSECAAPYHFLVMVGDDHVRGSRGILKLAQKENILITKFNMFGQESPYKF